MRRRGDEGTDHRSAEHVQRREGSAYKRKICRGKARLRSEGLLENRSLNTTRTGEGLTSLRSLYKFLPEQEVWREVWSIVLGEVGGALSTFVERVGHLYLKVQGDQISE